MHSNIFVLGPGALHSDCPVDHPNSITLTQRNRSHQTTTIVFVFPLWTVSWKKLGSQKFMGFLWATVERWSLSVEIKGFMIYIDLMINIRII